MSLNKARINGCPISVMHACLTFLKARLQLLFLRVIKETFEEAKANGNFDPRESNLRYCYAEDWQRKLID